MNDGTVRCRTCGALAAAGVEWCQQCYAPLPATPAAKPADRPAAPEPEVRDETPDAHPVPAPPMPVPPRAPRDLEGVPTAPAVLPGSPPPQERQSSDAPERPPPAGTDHTPALLAELWDLPTVPEPGVRGDFPAGLFPDRPERDPAAPDDGVSRVASIFSDEEQSPAKPPATWPCAVCGEANALDRDTCAVCLAPFSKLFDTARGPRVEPRTAAIRSLLFPGLGHAAAGKAAEGVARGILFLWCIGTGVALIIGHPAGGLGVLVPIAGVFILAAVGFYAVTALDAARVAAGDRQLVSARGLLYGTAGLMGLSVVSLFFVIARTGHVP